MTIYFYTRQRTVCRKIADALEENEHTCCIYTDFNDFYDAILNMKRCPDLLLLDYFTFDHDAFNVYRYMRDIKCLIPLIFYDNPFPSNRVKRISHWCMILNLFYSDVENINVASYVPVFNQIATTLELNDVKSHAALLHAKSQYEKNTASKACTYEPATEYKMLLPCALYRVFKILHAQHGNAISTTQIKQLLADEGIDKKIASIYSDICRLKKYLNSRPSLHIERFEDGYRLITYE
ncbi:MAG: hypothetical protein IJR50_08005 [Treponema sp.]|nr:hypothetical protein [Treponema sp.]